MGILIPGNLVFILNQGGGGGRLNIKMASYQYRDSHVKDKTGIHIPGKDGLYIETGPWFFVAISSIWDSGLVVLAPFVSTRAIMNQKWRHRMARGSQMTGLPDLCKLAYATCNSGVFLHKIQNLQVTLVHNASSVTIVWPEL